MYTGYDNQFQFTNYGHEVNAEFDLISRRVIVGLAAGAVAAAVIIK